MGNIGGKFSAELFAPNAFGNVQNDNNRAYNLTVVQNGIGDNTVAAFPEHHFIFGALSRQGAFHRVSERFRAVYSQHVSVRRFGNFQKP